jgi:AraC-like DNA-binding protein
LIKKELGKTPNRVRQEAKCQQAVRLLTCTDLPVEEISTRLGFSSSSYMRKLLRLTTGKTPLQIRKAAQSM